MKAIVLGLVAVVTVAVLAGCSARDSAGQSADPSQPSMTPSSTIAVVSRTTGLVRLDWTDTGTLREGRPVVNVENKNCVTPKGVSVRETASTVTVTAWGKKSKEPCSAIGYALAGAVPMHDPLGHRTLKHG